MIRRKRVELDALKVLKDGWELTKDPSRYSRNHIDVHYEHEMPL
jgi:hypothetical protein